MTVVGFVYHCVGHSVSVVDYNFGGDCRFLAETVVFDGCDVVMLV